MTPAGIVNDGLPVHAARRQLCFAKPEHSTGWKSRRLKLVTASASQLAVFTMIAPAANAPVLAKDKAVPAKIDFTAICNLLLILNLHSARALHRCLT